MVRLEDVVSEEKFAIVDGPFGTQLHISDFVPEGVPVVGIENVSTNEFVNKNLNYITAYKYKELKRSTIRPNDLLITKTGTIVRTCIVPVFIKIGIITSRLAKITLDQSKCFHKYLSYFINYDNQTINNLKTSCTGSTMPILNLTSLGNLQITLPPLPTQHKIVKILEEADNLRKLRQYADDKMKDLIPPLPLQREFAKLVEDIEAEKARQGESRKKLDELFNSLMQRAFTGELVA